MLKDCKCGDPRFPVPDGHVHCEAANPVASKNSLKKKKKKWFNKDYNFNFRKMSINFGKFMVYGKFKENLKEKKKIEKFFIGFTYEWYK